MVKISSLPISIKNMQTHLPITGRWTKEAVGPNSANPGPTFPKHAILALAAATIS